MENKKVIDTDDLKVKISKWANHGMSIRGRDKLVTSDEMWDKTFIDLQNNKDDLEIQSLIVKPDTLLYRVHIGGNDKPDYDDYDDRGEDQNKVYEYKYKEWLDENNVEAIRFDNHWVSFTKDVDVIGSDYFGEKGRRGFVIVISSNKAINISSFRTKVFDEKEVVAPMNKETLKEILPFKDFMKKYGSGKSL
ncbi:hypothetical protein [Bacillus toyonensis]|uniref:Uncharacterized protein n=1 Tax=Bacillus toyonensis TaxID=155322 RepID=A0A2C4R259_9BACI|nr:hypothetical protein [Bacillus toyonensis]PGA92560.1 hypothetical protein COL93_26295 [Bacillus toyonensis]PHD71496.1 hypothetical protein COF40_07875 [Bacillus toyonensis]